MSKKLMEVIMGLDVSIFMRGYQGYRFMYLYINSSFQSLLGMYLYLEIHINVMSKKSVKVIPGLDVSNFLEIRGQGKHLPFLLACGYDFILS